MMFSGESSTSENKGIFVKFGVALAQKKFKSINESIDSIVEEAKVDFRMAYLLGQYLSARQNTVEAEKLFASVRDLNPLFLPGLTALGAAKLSNGKSDEALGMFKSLEKINPKNPDRKALMASACADLGLWQEAEQLLNEASAIDPNNSKVNEMHVRVAFHQGKTDDALDKLSTCDTTNEYFIAKLNDEAIKLSRAEQTEKAITLYNRAHKVAPIHLKYKLSYNIALAYKRKKDLKNSLIFCMQAQKECPASAAEKIKSLQETLQKELGNS